MTSTVADVVVVAA